MNLDESHIFTPWRATRFYIPLVIQAISQSFTYPLVASVVTHGPTGLDGYSAFAQTITVFMLLSALGAGLMTSTMVYGRTKKGLRQAFQLALASTAVVCFCLLLLALPYFNELVFGKLLGLPPDLRKVTRHTLLFCVPASFLFHMRMPYQAVLYNALDSFKANAATLGRIVGTLALSYVLVKLGIVGHIAGGVAFVLPVVGEMLVSRHFAMPRIRTLPRGERETATMREQFLFCLPLSLGGVLLSLSAFMVAAFIGRAADSVRMQALHYVAMGLINPLGLAGMRLQAVVLGFPPQAPDFKDRTFRFALGAGIVLAGITLLGQLDSVANFYFGRVQNLDSEDVALASTVMAMACLVPFFNALRGHAEGLAAWHRRPNAILAGQAVYLGTLVCALFVLLQLHAPGYLMGAVSISVASACAFMTTRLGVAWSAFEGQAPKFVRHGSETERI